VVETGGLENRLRGDSHGGSNPSSSASSGRDAAKASSTIKGIPSALDGSTTTSQAASSGAISVTCPRNSKRPSRPMVRTRWRNRAASGPSPATTKRKSSRPRCCRSRLAISASNRGALPSPTGRQTECGTGRSPAGPLDRGSAPDPRHFVRQRFHSNLEPLKLPANPPRLQITGEIQVRERR
jgi:hypothetical protein